MESDLAGCSISYSPYRRYHPSIRQGGDVFELHGYGLCLDSRVTEYFQSRLGQTDTYLCSISNGVFSCPHASLQGT
jgi:hypothetical protein